jgi:AGCS family alanine or glycine:cation symporter
MLGAVMQLDAVIAFSDSMIFIMSAAERHRLYILAPQVKRALAHYWAQLERGEIESRRAVAAD